MFVLETSSEVKPRMKLRLEAFSSFMAACGYETDTAIAEFLDIPRSVIWKMRKGNQRPSAEFIAVMKVKFPAVAMDRFFEAEVAGPRVSAQPEGAVA